MSRSRYEQLRLDCRSALERITEQDEAGIEWALELSSRDPDDTEAHRALRYHLLLAAQPRGAAV